MKKNKSYVALLSTGLTTVLTILLLQPVFSQATENQDVSIMLEPELSLKPHKIFTVSSVNCSAAKMTEVLAKATTESSGVYIDCNLSLKRTDVVTKRLVFEGPAANGITFNGNGATLNCGADGSINYNKDMIEVRSKSYLEGSVRKWDRPENVTIKNCNIIGSVRIWGMATNGQGKEYKDGNNNVNHYKNSSFTSDHVTTARNNAPTNIILDNLTITGIGRNPLYFAPGVTYCQLINSEIKGESEAVAMYLDAESKGNIVKNNKIHVETKDYPFEQWDRPLIGIDGSSSNYIYNNYFSSLHHGGIYLYRNCGEGGVVRHSTPSTNKIINNIFYYNQYTGDNPSIYVSSKDRGGLWDTNIGFCGDDDGYSFGSSRSNMDYATQNVIMQNRIFKRSVNDMIKTKNPAVNSPNYIALNETVLSASPRNAGCYVGSKGYKKDFILHGESIEVLDVGHGDPASYNYTCNDGELTRTTQNSKVTRLVFDCQVSGTNNGCTKNIGCPTGQKIIGIRAAANLEKGTITEAVLGNVPTNSIRIITSSDHISDGTAFIGNNVLRSGSKIITGVDGLNQISIGCKEHDSNGGDCHIKVVLYCR